MMDILKLDVSPHHDLRRKRKPYCSRFDHFWAAIDWSLPDSILAIIWNVDRGNLRSRRKRLKLGTPRWRLPEANDDKVFVAARDLEQLKARNFSGAKPCPPRATINRGPAQGLGFGPSITSTNQLELAASHSEAMPPLAVTNLGELGRLAELLLVDEPECELHHWLNLSAVLIERAKEIRQRIEQIAIAWIDANGPTEIGDVRYTVGHPKVVKCTDPKRCMDLLLTACGGDLDAVVGHLRTDPFKYGSVRSVLDEAVYQQLFHTEFKAKLVEGHAQPQLMSFNTRFEGRSSGQRAINSIEEEG